MLPVLRAILTMVRISSIETVPSAWQSPTHAGGRRDVEIRICAPAVRVPLSTAATANTNPAEARATRGCFMKLRGRLRMAINYHSPFDGCHGAPQAEEAVGVKWKCPSTRYRYFPGYSSGTRARPHSACTSCCGSPSGFLLPAIVTPL